ncbi:MAG: response regulator transcription factor [Ignavibacteriae bacterium]|nr:response regulator transcription factor [Ignavibacteriota bacterium]
MEKIRILIADDHSIIRTGLQMLFKSDPEFFVVAEAENGKQALELIQQHNPDIAILDISMPNISGIEATKLIKQKYPDVKVLILTIYENEEYVYQMIRAGANGYVLKDAGKKELFAAVRAVVAGKRFFSPGISELMIERFIKQTQEQQAVEEASKQVLTNREMEVLRLIAQGLTNVQIAEKLFLSVRTVSTHRGNIMLKLNIHDTAGLVRFAIKQGFLELGRESKKES